MKSALWEMIESDFRAFPETRAAGVSEEEVELSFREFPNLDKDYRQFVVRFGGGDVGQYSIFGLRLPPYMTDFGEPSTSPAISRYFLDKYERLSGWLIFAFDMSGYPIGFRPDGTIAIFAEDTREIIPYADSFEQFVGERCFPLDEGTPSQ